MDSMRWQMTQALAAAVVASSEFQAQGALAYTGNYDQTGPTIGQGTYQIPVNVRAEAVPDLQQDTHPSVILVSEDDESFTYQGKGQINVTYPFLFIFLQTNGHQPLQLQLRANVREIIRAIVFNQYLIGPFMGLQGQTTKQWDVS